MEDRAAGTRVLIGAGMVKEVAPCVEWEYSERGPIRSVMWGRAVTHSIRPGFDDGFLLPYQALLGNADLQGTDLNPLIAYAEGHEDPRSVLGPGLS